LDSSFGFSTKAMIKQIFKSRYATLFSFILIFISSSFLVRLALFIVSLSKISFTIGGVIKVFVLGLDYDIGVSLLLTIVYNLFLLLLPSKWSGSRLTRVFTYFGLFLMLLISFFSFFAELTFWQEFESRFNFIAVDYLIYTYEVINNINESYPLPLLIGGVLAFTSLVVWGMWKAKVLSATFNTKMSFKNRLKISGVMLMIALSYPFLLSNSYAETSANRYENELSKAGIYSFFSAFKNNELNYQDFYSLIPESQAYKLMRKQLQDTNSRYDSPGKSIRRRIKSIGKPLKPNVIMITVESLSADFLAHFGNTQGLTPKLDSLADQGLLFTNMYATGTRTVRGMEALSLSIPPTPGSSIVRRQHNENLTTVGEIFSQAGYSRTFYYGGDGYFDNMNEYFGSNGFDITDRGRNIKMSDNYATNRTIIPDSLVHFENAWGISDQDLFDAVIRGADKDVAIGKPFYNFVMTTSNHRPFTFPAGKIKLKAGSREAALEYTDFAIGKFLEDLKKKSWYKNTVVIIVADHCASSAGKNEVDISKYHIPCLVLNLPAVHEQVLSNVNKQVISKMCSQIDLYPTLFALLHWNYESNLFGRNVLDPGFEPRAVLGTYQKLAYLKSDSLVILGPQRKVETFLYNVKDNTQKPNSLPSNVINEAKANYQTAYDLFKNGGLHQ
jgi:phosphoglycerol transferase MdoB-like AlkP superfamily enzyme